MKSECILDVPEATPPGCVLSSRVSGSAVPLSLLCPWAPKPPSDLQSGAAPAGFPWTVRLETGSQTSHWNSQLIWSLCANDSVTQWPTSNVKTFSDGLNIVLSFHLSNMVIPNICSWIIILKIHIFITSDHVRHYTVTAYYLSFVQIINLQ